MNLANKTFVNNRTGETVKVIDTFENIAILENKQKVAVSALTDPLQYTPDIDPSQFFNNQGAYNSLLEKIKTIPTDQIVDDSLANQFGGEVRPSSDESAVIISSKEDEMEELARKYGVTTDNTDALSKQQQAFSKYLDEDEMPKRVEPTNQFNQFNQNINANNTEVNHIEVNRVSDDPILSMFKKTKRSVDFKMSIEYSNKIPRLDFIEMMEDSYETSIIDYLAEEFINEILSNPNQIKEKIKSKIKQLVYGGLDAKKETPVKPISEVKKPVTKSVKYRISEINKLDNIDSIKDLLKNEKSKSVIEFANKKIKELSEQVSTN